MAKVVRIEVLRDNKIRMPRRRLCIDIDTIDKIRNKPKRDWETYYNLIKALYQYSYIDRIVKETRHGFHIYLDINITRLNCDAIMSLKALFGDDIQRLELDEERCRTGYWINVCFTSSELYEVEHY